MLERGRLWREVETGSLERADEGTERIEKKEKHGHGQHLEARAAFPLSAMNQEQEALRVGLHDGEGPELQNGEPKGSDFVNSVMCESITGNIEQARQDQK